MSQETLVRREPESIPVQGSLFSLEGLVVPDDASELTPRPEQKDSYLGSREHQDHIYESALARLESKISARNAADSVEARTDVNGEDSKSTESGPSQPTPPIDFTEPDETAAPQSEKEAAINSWKARKNGDKATVEEVRGHQLATEAEKDAIIDRWRSQRDAEYATKQTKRTETAERKAAKTERKVAYREQRESERAEALKALRKTGEAALSVVAAPAVIAVGGSILLAEAGAKAAKQVYETTADVVSDQRNQIRGWLANKREAARQRRTARREKWAKIRKSAIDFGQGALDKAINAATYARNSVVSAGESVASTVASGAEAVGRGYEKTRRGIAISRAVGEAALGAALKEAKQHRKQNRVDGA